MAEVRGHLQPYHALLSVFDHCVAGFGELQGAAIAVKGSLAAGEVDCYSDLDFELVFDSGSVTHFARDRIIGTASSAGRLLASFSATHLGLPDLLIFFLEVDGSMVKVDVDMMPSTSIDAKSKRRVLFDPTGLISNPSVESPSPEEQFEEMLDIHQKFCGWLWYTYSKAARGELFEAQGSLGVMRELAVVPCLRLVNGLPMEGYRRLEARLNDRELTELRSTYAFELSRAAVVEALLRMADMFYNLQPRVAAMVGRDHRRADLDEMIRLIRLQAVGKPH